MSVAIVPKPKRAMPQGWSGRINLENEMALIRQVQSGDKCAMERLFVYYEPFVIQMAKKAAWFTGAYLQEEDLAQLARIVLFEKAKTYNFDYIKKRQETEANYRPARLSSYAFREIRRRMMQFACRNLEIVPPSSNSLAHAAHRLLDSGGDPVEIAKKLGLELETVLALERHTVPLSEEVFEMSMEDFFPDEVENAEIRQRAISACWLTLDPEERLVLALLHEEPDVKKRALAFSTDVDGLEMVEELVLGKFNLSAHELLEDIE